MNLVLSIAAGGALGAVSRHFLGSYVARLAGSGFPYSTMAVNIFGSFLMGVIVSLFALKIEASQELRAFLTVGLLGGFTTFSTFSLEAVLLFERGAYGGMVAYMGLSVLLAVGGLFFGLWAGRFFV